MIVVLGHTWDGPWNQIRVAMREPHTLQFGRYALPQPKSMNRTCLTISWASVLFVGALAAAPVGAPASTNWPQFRGPKAAGSL